MYKLEKLCMRFVRRILPNTDVTKQIDIAYFIACTLDFLLYTLTLYLFDAGWTMTIGLLVFFLIRKTLQTGLKYKELHYDSLLKCYIFTMTMLLCYSVLRNISVQSYVLATIVIPIFFMDYTPKQLS
jgi:hypothetical protein